VSTGSIGHGYFNSSPVVSWDLILMLRENLGPEDSGRPLIKRDVRFFEINDRYPTFADDQLRATLSVGSQPGTPWASGERGPESR